MRWAEIYGKIEENLLVQFVGYYLWVGLLVGGMIILSGICGRLFGC